MYFYGRRYVGMLTLLLPEQSLRISTLSFWGAREETQVKLKRVVAPFQGLSYKVFSTAAESTFFPMIVEDDRTYIVTLRWWPLTDTFDANTDTNKILIRLL